MRAKTDIGYQTPHGPVLALNGSRLQSNEDLKMGSFLPFPAP